MVIAGGALFVFAHMLEPYMATASGYTSYIIIISTAILLAVPTGALIGFGVAQVAGVISINVEGGK